MSVLYVVGYTAACSCEVVCVNLLHRKVKKGLAGSDIVQPLNEKRPLFSGQWIEALSSP